MLSKAALIKLIKHTDMNKTILTIKEKLISSKGESIGETLVALLVMCLAMLVLSGSIVSAARINKRALDMETATLLKGTESSKLVVKDPAKVNVSGGPSGVTGISKDISVILYTDKTNNNEADHFKFYELK